MQDSAWKEPTPIQMQAIPCMLAGRDVLAAAPTGSGKTAAFVLPALACLNGTEKGGARALILAPTRSLATQIHRDVVRLSRGTQLKACLLKKAAARSAAGDKTSFANIDIMVSTPMRLVSVLRAGAVSLATVKMVVLDEADKLFDVGRSDKPEDTAFITQLDEILAGCTNDKLQRALFSATLGPAVHDLASSILRNPVQITVGTANAGAPSIDQKLIFVGKEEGKLLAIRQLVQQGLKPPVLVFLQDKDRAKELFHELVYDGINVDVIHSDRTQQQRDTIIENFRHGDIWVLICTDLMSRGIDFLGVNMVINYDLPQSAISYIHRIGRTGRAGRRGTAITMFTEEDMSKLRSIANVVNLSGCDVPDWMLSVKKLCTRDKKQLLLRAPNRSGISTVSGFDKKMARNRASSRHTP
ncbi:unnamed protein product [Chrysoparadoxa australica]